MKLCRSVLQGLPKRFWSLWIFDQGYIREVCHLLLASDLQLENVEFIDSSGLGAMMRLVQAARAKGGDLKLCGLTPKIRKVLELTHLLAQFEVCECLEEAITATRQFAKRQMTWFRNRMGDYVWFNPEESNIISLLKQNSA